MKLATLKTDQGNRVVAVLASENDTKYIDLMTVDATIPRSLKGLLAQTDGLSRAREAYESGTEIGAFVTGELLAPIPEPGKVICIGLNYRDHAEESGMDIPSEPVCFSKFANTITGPETTIKLPAVSKQVDYEAELVVVIGKTGKNIPAGEALNHVAGYMNGNDVSARDWQIGRPGGQWLLGKTPDTFAPIGPWLVTTEEAGDPNNLKIALRLNGESMQDSNTKEFIFTVEEVIEHLSKIMTLEPGDIIFTGTPPGVGMARKPPVFLKPGDATEVEIEGLGVLRNNVAAE